MRAPRFIQVSTPYLLDTPDGPAATLYKGQATGKTEAPAVAWLVPAEEPDSYPDAERDPWEPAPRPSRPRTPERAAYLARLQRATARARLVIKPGDRISRKMCGGLRGTFTFTHWDGDWLCGRTVSDCGASSVLKVNGAPVDFDDPPPARPWHELIEEMAAADRAAAASPEAKAPTL